MYRIFVFTLCLFLIAIASAGTIAIAEEDNMAPGGGFNDETPAFLYAAFYEYGLQVFDVSNPEDPVNVGEYITSAKEAFDIAIAGNFAYIADGKAGLQIYDISNLKKIKLAKSFKRPADARAIEVAGNYAYLAAADSMQIFDVSDPANAFWITTYQEDIKYDQELEVVGDYAYVACGVEGLKIYDISNPLNTHKVGQVIPPGMARKVAVQGKFAYIAAGAAGLEIIDITYPDDPQIACKGLRTGDLAYGVFVDGNTAYIADRNDGLHIIDVSNPMAPVELAKLRLKGKASDIVVMGGYAFVAATTGDISIVNVANPSKPTLVKWLRWNGTARSVVVVG